jgi:hypothetical protein
MTATVVAVLMLHYQTCDRCQAGAPCLAAEQVQDAWISHAISTLQVNDALGVAPANAA